MIDVGGPSMLRAAAKNFAHVTVVSSPSQYERRPRPSCARHGDTTPETRKRLARRGVRDDRGLRGGDLELVRQRAAVPGTAHDRPPQGHRPLVRREPAPGGGLLPRARRRRHLLSRDRAARRQGALVQQPRRSRRRAAHRPRARRCRRRDRQARESLRGGGGRDDRGGLGARARCGSGVGVRLCRGAEPAGRRGARRTHRRALRRGAARARLRRGGGRGPARAGRRCASWSTASSSPRRRASATTSACSAASSCRTATTGREERATMQLVAGELDERSGPTCCSPGRSASTSRRTRSCWCATCRRSGSARAR